MADWRRSRPTTLAAPAPSPSSVRAPGRDEALPAVDDRAVRPETNEELVDGRIVHAQPANEPHARANSDLAALLTVHAARGYLAAVDLLIRTDARNDFAPDASLYPEGNDEVTGGRKLEQMAFEICDSQTRARAGEKARKLSARGVARVFCIDVNEYEVLEWSSLSSEWSVLSLDSAIEDACLVRPLAVAALLDAVERDNELARALLTKENPVLMQRLATARATGRVEGKREGKREGRSEGRSEGEAEGLREAVRVACRLLEIAVDEAREATIATMDEASLRALLRAIEQGRVWPADDEIGP